MPTFVYKCEDCGEEVTKLRKAENMDKELMCDSCLDGLCIRLVVASNYAFKKSWMPTKDGWKRTDM